jgi:hypothetical protein
LQDDNEEEYGDWDDESPDNDELFELQHAFSSIGASPQQSFTPTTSNQNNKGGNKAFSHESGLDEVPFIDKYDESSNLSTPKTLQDEENEKNLVAAGAEIKIVLSKPTLSTKSF